MQMRKAPPVETPYSWWVAGISLLMGSLSFGAVNAVPILLKPICDELRRSTAEVASVHGAVLLCVGVASLLMGRLHDRFGFFPLAISAALATGAGLVLASGATTLPQLYLAFGLLVGACGQGVLFSPLSAAVSQWFGRHRALAVAIAACGQGIGGLLVPSLMRWQAELHGWREALLGFGVVSGTLLLLCSFVFCRPAPQASVLIGSPSDGPSAMSAPLPLAPLGCCLALTTLGTFVAIGHLTAAAEEAGTAPVAAAALLSALLGTSLISRLSAPLLGRRAGALATLRIASVIHVVGLCALAMFHRSYAGTALSAAFVGIGFGAYLPGYAVVVLERYPPREAGRRIAEVYCFGFCGSAVGSWVGGVLRDISGNYGLAFWAAAASSVTGLLAFSLLYRPRS